METPTDRFWRILSENNLKVDLTTLNINKMDNGGVVVAPPQLVINFTDPKKEEDGTERPSAQ